MIKDIEVIVHAVFCDECGKDVHRYQGWPYVEDGGKHYCPSCAYTLGKITEEEWCNMHGIYVDNRHIKNSETTANE